MKEMLFGNLRAHFIYFRRSKLLLAFTLVFLGFMLLFSLLFILMSSRLETFQALQQIYSRLDEFLILLSAGFGLFIISSHLQARNLKMVFTKPCPPAFWLATVFISAALLSLALQAVVLAAAVVADLILHAHVLAALVYASLDAFASSLGMLAYLIFLSMILHPVMAALFALVFQQGTFYMLQLSMQSLLAHGSKSALVKVLEHIFHFCYMALPMIHANSSVSTRVSGTLHLMAGDWTRLLISFAYAAALAGLCYCLSLFFLERKRLI